MWLSGWLVDLLPFFSKLKRMYIDFVLVCTLDPLNNNKMGKGVI